MDSDLSPEYYRDESPEFAVRETEEVVKHCEEIDPQRRLITPIVTPRFAPSCSPKLLSSLGELSAKADLPIQTHISENTSEIALVQSLFPEQDSYAEVYDHHRLLTPRTVLAHGVHLSADEKTLIKDRESNISHCPVSNTSLSSGLCPVRDLLDRGITVGLGTDVSGGYSSSILVAAREAAMVSRTLAAISPEDVGLGNAGEKRKREDGDGEAVSGKDRKKLSVEECLYLATAGGAKCLGLEGKVGGFEVGMQWDAQLVQLASTEDREEMNEAHEGGLPDLYGKESWEEKVAKWMFCGDDRNTMKVYVAGRLIHDRLA